MATPGRSGAGWTENEKLSLYLQIISKTAAKIPWNELELPAGRTIKACQMVIDKDRRQVKQATNGSDSPAGDNGDGIDGGETPSKKKASPKKRKNESGEGKATKAKKAKKVKGEEVVQSDDDDAKDVKEDIDAAHHDENVDGEDEH